jgi:hypothetical protein
VLERSDIRARGAVVFLPPNGVRQAEGRTRPRPNLRAPQRPVTFWLRSEQRVLAGLICAPMRSLLFRAIEAIGGSAVKQALAQHHCTHMKVSVARDM